MNRFLILLPFVFAIGNAGGQTLGGSSAYGFLKLQQLPRVGALGGRNVSLFGTDVSLSMENPALLREEHHGQVSASFSFFPGVFNALHAIGAFNHASSNTNFAIGVMHVPYGTAEQTDVAGNTLGNFNAFDQVVSFTASRSMGERWHYGVTAKFIRSSYGTFNSMGIAADAGLNYILEEKGFQVGFSAKNMGTMLTAYAGEKEDLPFDLLLGISKRLEKAPLQFSITAQRLHRYRIVYDDPLFDQENFGMVSEKRIGYHLLSHLIVGAEVFIGERIILEAGFNMLRRNELAIRNLANGLTGMGYGMHFNMGRLNFSFARTHFTPSKAQQLVSFSYRLVPEAQK